MITIKDKEKEYDLFRSSVIGTIRTKNPGGSDTVWHRCWDYKDELVQTSFKTEKDPSGIENPRIQYEKIDLMPISGIQFWKVTILRK